MDAPMIMGLAVVVIGSGIFFIVALVKSILGKGAKWIIATVVSAVLCLSGLAVAMSQVVKSVAKAAKVARLKKDKISSSDGSVSISVPSTWKAMPELSETASLGAGNNLRGAFVMVIREPKMDFTGTLAEYDALISGSMLERMADGKLSEPETLSLGEYPAIRRRLEGTIDGLRLVYQLDMVESAGAMHQIVQWTSPSKEAETVPEFREVAESFGAKDGPPEKKTGSADSAPNSQAGIPGRVAGVVAELLGGDPAELSLDSRFIEDLGADSLDCVELVMALEEEFAVDIDDDVAAGWKTPADVVAWLEAQAAGNGATGVK